MNKRTKILSENLLIKIEIVGKVQKMYNFTIK